MFLRVVLCSEAVILYSKYQFLSDSSRVHITVDHCRLVTTQLW